MRIFHSMAIVTALMGIFEPKSLQAEDKNAIKPEWVKTMRPPKAFEKNCYLGSISSSPNREKALDEAYKGALIEVVRKEFPELIKISEKSSESLVGSSYVRDTIFESDKIQFLGIEENQDSPFIEESRGSGYDAYRMLCWKTDAISAERKRQRDVTLSQDTGLRNHFDNVIPSGTTSRAFGKIEVISIPAGATILLDANPIGTSNAAFEKVATGKYDLVLQKDGYEIKRESIIIVSGKTTRLAIELVKVKSTITIKSTPPGVRVYVDNKPKESTTPITLTDDIGKKIDLRLEMSDYRSVQRTIEFTDRPSEEAIDMTLLPGKISVLSTPSKANVAIDGVQKGITPIYGMTQSGGGHSLQISLSGFEDYAEEFDVRSSKALTIMPKLIPILKPSSPAIPPTPALIAGHAMWNKIGPLVGWGFIATGVALAAVAYENGKMADDEFNNYKEAKDQETISKSRNRTEMYNANKTGMSIGSGICIFVGSAIILDLKYRF